VKVARRGSVCFAELIDYQKIEMNGWRKNNTLHPNSDLHARWRLCSVCGKREESGFLPRTCDCKSIDLLWGALDVAVIYEENADGSTGTARISCHTPSCAPNLTQP
jgi:hypothetical protein